MKIDFDILAKTYFYFDEPVPYDLGNGNSIKINPISVRDSEIFLSSIDILNIDKNSSSSVEVIQMSYLQFLYGLVCSDESKVTVQKLVNILKLCFGMTKPAFANGDDGKIRLVDSEMGVTITGKQFDDLKRIVMFQNIIHFDDEYVNPEFKQAISEVDSLKNRNIEIPTLERRMAIISAHTGISKKEQLSMTYRSHTALFEEVCGEVEYSALKAISAYSGKADDVQWIYKKKKGKYDDYITSTEKYSNSMGGDGGIRSNTSSVGEGLATQFNSFNK